MATRRTPKPSRRPVRRRPRPLADPDAPLFPAGAPPIPAAAATTGDRIGSLFERTIEEAIKSGNFKVHKLEVINTKLDSAARLVGTALEIAKTRLWDQAPRIWHSDPDNAENMVERVARLAARAAVAAPAHAEIMRRTVMLAFQTGLVMGQAHEPHGAGDDALCFEQAVKDGYERAEKHTYAVMQEATQKLEAQKSPESPPPQKGPSDDRPIQS